MMWWNTCMHYLSNPFFFFEKVGLAHETIYIELLLMKTIVH